LERANESLLLENLSAISLIIPLMKALERVFQKALDSQTYTVLDQLYPSETRERLRNVWNQFIPLRAQSYAPCPLFSLAGSRDRIEI